MMKALAVLAILSVVTKAQYLSRTTTEIPLSVLSKYSPRAGPARKNPNVQAQVLTSDSTIQTFNPFGSLTPAQVIGANSANLGTGAYTVTLDRNQLLTRTHFQNGKDDGGYEVSETPQEEPLGPTPQTYQLTPQRKEALSAQNQPRTIHQFQFPVSQDAQSPEPEQSLFIPYNPQQNQQYLREISRVPAVSSNSPVNFPETQGQQQPSFTLQQQFYEQEPQIQYVQSNPSIPAPTPTPAPQVSPINPSSYNIPSLSVLGRANNNNNFHQIVTPRNGYEPDPSTYTGSQQYYTVPATNLNSLQETAPYNAQSPIRGYFNGQIHTHSTTARPLITVGKALTNSYQQIPEVKDLSSQRIYNYNQPIGNIQPQQQLGDLAYAQRQRITGSYAPEAVYNAQNSFARNPIEYASPFARQELLETRQIGAEDQRSLVGRLNEGSIYDTLSKADQRKNTLSSRYPLNLYA